MNAPANIANAARARIREASAEIKQSLRAIDAGRPGDAEPDAARFASVVQTRSKLSAKVARQVAPFAGPEAVWGNTVDFVDVSFFERGLLAARSVCRIVTRNGQGIGAGFLISPRLLITNNHVITTKSAASRFVAEFDYERDLAGSRAL